ncbi:response regulator transcription factor [Aliidiomarina sp. Khilg15.8]
MSFIMVSGNAKWLASWRSLLELTQPERKQVCCASLSEFARLRFEPDSLVFIDTASTGLPKYLPYNPLLQEMDCRFVLVNTGVLEDNGLLHFLKHGYSGIIKGSEKPEVVLKALEGLSKNESWFPRRIVERAVRDYQNASTTHEQVVYELAAAYGLSKREQQVCLALVEGEKNCEIAGKLFISKHTVKCHVTNLYRKLGVNSRHQILSTINNRMKRTQGLLLTS